MDTRLRGYDEFTGLAKVLRKSRQRPLAEHLVGNDALYSREDAAKILRTGRRRLWKALQSWRIVQTSGMPYQTFFDEGYFRRVPVLIHKGRYSLSSNQAMVTSKRLTWLKAVMDAHAMPEKALMKAEART